MLTVASRIRGAAQPRSGSAHRATGNFRTDIEGLRAVAVLLVLLDHLCSWPRGGFVGVDVFFVISGYLITGILLKEFGQTGRISVRGFYVRRARRILPASLAVLAAVTVAAQLTFRGSRVHDTVVDVWWALGFSANIHFADIGTDYFQVDRPLSPVQHYWSLAVEEQFYLIWPLAMLGVLYWVSRQSQVKNARTVLLGVVGTASLASFVVGLSHTASSPSSAYFSTPSRAWELGVGAVIAVSAARFPGATRGLGRARGPLCLLGLLGIVLSALTLSSASAFPVPAAALPVLSSAFVITAGIEGQLGHWAVALTNPVSKYLGRVSFSLYLWHWPVILFCAALMKQNTVFYYPFVVFVIGAFTVFSYHYVEAPFRRSPTGTAVLPRPVGGGRFGRGSGDSGRGTRAPSRRRTPLVAVCVLTVAASLCWVLRPPPTAPPPATLAAAVAPGPAGPSRTVARPSKALAESIVTAVGATRWPKFDPPLESLGAASAQASWRGCRAATESTLPECTFGDVQGGSAKVAVVLGDSIAMSWLPAIRSALSSGWVVYGLTRELCPAAFVTVNSGMNPSQPSTACDAHHAFVVSEAKKLHPALVILANASGTVGRLHDKAVGRMAQEEYRIGLVTMIRALDPGANRRIVTLSPPPVAPSLQRCDSASAAPADCISTVSEDPEWGLASRAEQAASKEMKTRYVDTHLWFCTSSGYCPSFVGTTPVRFDDKHLTERYAETLGAELAPILKEPGR